MGIYDRLERLEQRVAQLEGTQAVPPQPEMVYDILLLGVGDGSQALLRLGDIRITEAGVLIFHPHATNLAKSRDKSEVALVSRLKGGLVVTLISPKAAVRPQVGVGATPTSYDHGWNRIVEIRFDPTVS